MATNGFDRVARIYRWGEALTFGSLLMRCRLAFLNDLTSARSVLVLGDGDGRFTAAALAQHPQLHITAVDISATMLQLLQQRCEREGTQARLTTVHSNALQFTPTQNFDVVVTHFFLDCLTTEQVLALGITLRTTASRWIISEFDIPHGVLQWPARALVRSLYVAFRLLTALKVQQLPQWRDALVQSGYGVISRRTLIGGILAAELWQCELR